MRANLRYMLLLALSVMLYGCDGGSKIRYSYEEYGLNCPVKSVKVLTYEAKSKFGDVTKGDLSRSGNYTAQFNEVGNIKQLSTYDATGDLNGMTRYKYNEDDQLVELSVYGSDGELQEQFSHEYDNGHIISSTLRSYWSDEEEIRKWAYIWDGDELKEQHSMLNGKLTAKTIYHVNNEQRSEWTTYNIGGEQLNDKVYSGYEVYNEEGQLTNYCSGDYSMEVKYNEQNLPVYLKNAGLLNNTTILFYPEGEETEYYAEYKYDSQGNWIEQIIYEGFAKKPVSISERVINY